MGEPRHEGPEPPWWRPITHERWRMQRERRLAWHTGWYAGQKAALGEVYDLLEANGFVNL